MFFASPKILEAAHKVAETLIATGQDRGEVPFSPAYRTPNEVDQLKLAA